MKNILNHQSSRIESSALILAIFAIIGSCLSVFRNALLASTFGASRMVDMYYASFRIPDFIFNIFILGALAAGFIPLFIKYSNIGKKEANEFGTSIMVGISFFSALLGIIFVIFANPIIKLLFPGFSSADLHIIANLSRIIMVQPILLGLSSLIGNILQVNNLYVPVAIAPLLYNLGIISGIVIFYPLFGLYGLAYGVVVGAFLNLIIKYWPFRKVDFVFSMPHSSIFKKYIKEFTSLTVFRALSIINLQLFLFVISNVASYLKAGSLGIMTFASNIQDFPRSVFAMSFAIASFPILSKQFANKEKKEFTDTYQKTLTQILAFLIPIFFAFLVFREQIVRLLLGYGKFDWSATTSTIFVFTILIFGFVVHSLHDFLLNVLFAVNNTKAPFFSGLSAFSIAGILAFYLGKKFGLPGLALSCVVADTLYFLFLFLNTLRYLEPQIIKNLFSRVSLISLSAFISGIFAWLTLHFMNTIFSSSKIFFLVINSFVSGMVMVTIYLILMSWFKMEEFNTIIGFFKKRLFKLK